jgi:hemerythrin-like domain-containing protein
MPEGAIAADRDPYAVLAREHRLIERGLDVLGAMCSQVGRGGPLDVADAGRVIQFLREFADRTHHLKEEQILFPAIDTVGFFPGCGLVTEHQTSRKRVGGMADAVSRHESGDAEARRDFLRQARSYIALLREHIAKEDDCLASVVERTFSEEDRVRLVREFDEAERREFGDRVLERYTEVIEALEAKYARREEAK